MAQDDQHNTVVCRAPELSDLQQQIAMLEDQKQQLQSEKDKLEKTLVQQLAAAQATNPVVESFSRLIGHFGGSTALATMWTAHVEFISLTIKMADGNHTGQLAPE